MINEVFCEQKKKPKKIHRQSVENFPEFLDNVYPDPGLLPVWRIREFQQSATDNVLGCSKSATDNARLQQQSRDIADYICPTELSSFLFVCIFINFPQTYVLIIMSNVSLTNGFLINKTSITLIWTSCVHLVSNFWELEIKRYNEIYPEAFAHVTAFLSIRTWRKISLRVWIKLG